MKITKSYLKQIIKEEITRLNEEEGVQQEEIPQAVLDRKTGRFIGKIEEKGGDRYYFCIEAKKSWKSNKLDHKSVSMIMYSPQSNRAETASHVGKYSLDKSDQEIFNTIEDERTRYTRPSSGPDSVDQAKKSGSAQGFHAAKILRPVDPIR